MVSNYAVALYRKIKLRKNVYLHPVKNYYFSIFMLVMAAGLYYSRNIYLNILSLTLVLIYVFIVNKGLILDIKKLIFGRLKRKND